MTLTFDIKKTNKKNPSNNNNASKSIDALILANLKKTAPYLFGKGKKAREDKSATYIFERTSKPTPKKSISITIENKKPATRTAFFDAFNYIIKDSSRDTYDFKLDDGTPVKLFSDEIQIGYDILPINEATMYLYNNLSEERKQNIIDIYINIKRK